MNLGWLNKESRETQTLLKTIYEVTRREPKEVQQCIQIAIAWVIVNRKRANRNYWGGSTISGVCKGDRRLFNCWYNADGTPKNDEDIAVSDDEQDEILRVLTPDLHDGVDDPTKGSTYYYNIAIQPTIKRGSYQFYKEGKL